MSFSNALQKSIEVTKSWPKGLHRVGQTRAQAREAILSVFKAEMMVGMVVATPDKIQEVTTTIDAMLDAVPSKHGVWA